MKLSSEALDALLAEHVKIPTDRVTDAYPAEFYCGADDCEFAEWPCTIYLLASEVRDARPKFEIIREWVDAKTDPDTALDAFTIDILKSWMEFEILGRPGKTLAEIKTERLAHYEEGTEMNPENEPAGVRTMEEMMCQHPNLVAIEWEQPSHDPLRTAITRVTALFCPFCRKTVRP